MSGLIFSLVLLRIYWESLEIIPGSSCILDENAKKIEYLTKAPLVPDAIKLENWKCVKKINLKNLKDF